MKFTINDKSTIAVLEELSFRLDVPKEAIVQTVLKELANQYVTKPTLATQFAKMQLKKQGVI